MCHSNKDLHLQIVNSHEANKYYEMSNCLNVEMHKQAEIAKRLNAICLQIIPFLSQEVSAAKKGGGGMWCA